MEQPTTSFNSLTEFKEYAYLVLVDRVSSRNKLLHSAAFTIELDSDARRSFISSLANSPDTNITDLADVFIMKLLVNMTPIVSVAQLAKNRAIEGDESVFPARALNNGLGSAQSKLLDRILTEGKVDINAGNCTKLFGSGFKGLYEPLIKYGLVEFMKKEGFLVVTKHAITNETCLDVLKKSLDCKKVTAGFEISQHNDKAFTVFNPEATYADAPTYIRYAQEPAAFPTHHSEEGMTNDELSNLTLEA